MKEIEYFAVTGEKIELGQECYYSEITNQWYKNFDAVLKHHIEEGFTEEEIRDLNKELVIYYTTYPEE